MTNPLTLARVPQPARWLVNSLSRLPVLCRWYDEWLSGDGGDANDFLNYTLDKTGVNFDVVNEAVLSALPNTDSAKKEPLIIVANHPLGGLEGMLLSRLLLQYRKDLKVLTNEMLLSFKEFNDLFIGVDVLNPNKQAQNAKGMRQVAKHLSTGGALLVFPSGTVARMTRNNWAVTEAPWQDIVGRLALKYKATCLPIYISGKNSRLFYLSGLVHPRLRTLLLPRAMISKKGEVVRAIVGKPLALAAEDLTPEAATDYLRLQCELLAETDAPMANNHALTNIAVTNAEQRASAEQHLAQRACDCIVRRGELAVYCLAYDALGPLRTVLANEREKTFRAAGEGTGRACDQDRFDPLYHHIVAWDHSAQQLVGSYRAANVANVVAKVGLKGLYSYSLFAYDQRFLASLGGSIEVGRSFVTQGYQNNSNALDLLWCGLGGFMLRNPECHTFFGCVSISQAFAPVVRALLVDTLMTKHAADDNTRTLVKAHMPVALKEKFWSDELIESMASMTAINKLLGRANYQFRVPALIRHYLALKGRFIDFSVNTQFSHSMDGLIYVDLRKTPPRYLKRYLGVEGARFFQTRWNCLAGAA